MAFDAFGEFQATGRFVLVDGYDVAGGGIILSAEKNIAAGTVFAADGLKIENATYKIGDQISTTGFSFNYPAAFDIILLQDSGFVKIRGKKITAIF